MPETIASRRAAARHVGVDPTTVLRWITDGLLPPILRQQLLRCHEDGERLQVRVMPSPQMAAVPWGLLPIDGPNSRLSTSRVETPACRSTLSTMSRPNGWA